MFRHEVGPLYPGDPDDPFGDENECAVTTGSSEEKEVVGLGAEEDRPDVESSARLAEKGKVRTPCFGILLDVDGSDDGRTRRRWNSPPKHLLVAA